MIRIWSYSLPLNNSRAPCQTGAKNDQKDQIPALDQTRADRFIEGNRDGGSGGVSELVQIDEDLFGARAKPFTHSVNNAAIRLMRNHQFDLGDVNLATAQCFLCR